MQVMPLPAVLEPREPAAEAGPAIQVTIGRIEVRAVLPAAAPPPRPAVKRPAASLEEYLRAREGGKR
jgi:hypothetical protein